MAVCYRNFNPVCLHKYCNLQDIPIIRHQSIMRILHTADWHLGKRLDNFSRHEEQLLVLEEIIAIADREAADVVIIAGDLYDSFNPPMESQSLLYKTLKRLV